MVRFQILLVCTPLIAVQAEFPLTSVTIKTGSDDPKMTLEYQLSEDKSKVDFSASLVSDQGGYLSVGLSAAGRMGSPSDPSDVVICHGEKELTRYWVQGYALPAGTPIAGSCDVAAGTMAWSMPVQPEGDQQRPILLSDDGPSTNILIWAIGTGKDLGFHKYWGSLAVDIGGEEDPVEVTVTVQAPSEHYIHGILMIVAWGFLIPAAVMTAKFRFNNPTGSLWIKVHRLFNSLGLLAQLAGVITIIVYKADVGTSFDGTTTQEIHYYGGIVIVGLALLQPLNAWFRPSQKEPKSPGRVYWEYLHKGLGWLLVLAGLANCALPLSWITGNLLTVIACVYALGIVLLIVYGVTQLFCSGLYERNHQNKAPDAQEA